MQDFLKALVATCGEQNAVFKARNALLGLRHDDSVLEYARKFGSYAAEGIGWLRRSARRGSSDRSAHAA